LLFDNGFHLLKKPVDYKVNQRYCAMTNFGMI
jgi:hypothetical protein